jgi:hypothetical protein
LVDVAFSGDFFDARGDSVDETEAGEVVVGCSVAGLAGVTFPIADNIRSRYNLSTVEYDLFLRRISTAELATNSGLPVPTVKWLVAEGVLAPSVQAAQGRGSAMVFSFADVVGAGALRMLHFPNMAAGPLRHVADYFRSEKGQEVIQEAMRVEDRESQPPRLLCITSKGAVLDVAPEVLMKQEQVSVVYCIDVNRLVGDMMVNTTEGMMAVNLEEPGPSGRVPLKPKAVVKKRTARMKKLEAKRKREQ